MQVWNDDDPLNPFAKPAAKRTLHIAAWLIAGLGAAAGSVVTAVIAWVWS